MGNHTILYKYRNFESEFHLDILRKNELYFATVLELNDPFDMSVSVNFDNTNQYQVKRNIDEAIQNGIYDDFKISRNMMRKDFALRLQNYEKFKQEYQESINSEILNFGILSLSKICNNILMWSHYSLNHTGFCIGIDINKFKERFNNYFGIYEIKYKAEGEFPNPFMRSKDKIFTDELFQLKYEIWKYEQEVRVAYKLNSLKKQKLVFEDSLINEVILGLNCNIKNENIIKEILKHKYRIKLYKMQKKLFSFELEKIEVKL